MGLSLLVVIFCQFSACNRISLYSPPVTLSLSTHFPLVLSPLGKFLNAGSFGQRTFVCAYFK